MSTIAVRNIRRPDAGTVESLQRFGVATLHEAQGRSGLMDAAIRPIYVGAALCGPAVTVLTHPGDNWMLHVAAELLKPGDVLVIACSAPNGDGMFGELLATSFRARGAKGLVSDTGVRDVKEISASEVALSVGDSVRKVPNDYVYIFAGGEAPNEFLKKIGVRIEKKFGQA